MAARWQMKMRKFGQTRDDLMNSQDPIFENYLKKVYEKIGGAVESFNSTAPIIEEVNSENEDATEDRFQINLRQIEERRLSHDPEEVNSEDDQDDKDGQEEEEQEEDPNQYYPIDQDEEEEHLEELEHEEDHLEEVQLEEEHLEELEHEEDHLEEVQLEEEHLEELEHEEDHLEEVQLEEEQDVEFMEQQNLECEPDHEAQPVQEPDQISLDEEILRRSKRAKLPLLNNARLERAVYDFDGGFVRIDNGFPEKYDYSKKKTTKRNKTRIPKNCIRVEPITYKKAAKGDYEFDVKSDTNSIQGFVRLRPGCKKPESRTNYAYIFKVKKGQVAINVIEGKKVERFYLDENSWSLRIDENKHYGIKNCGPKIATLSFIVVKA